MGRLDERPCRVHRNGHGWYSGCHISWRRGYGCRTTDNLYVPPHSLSFAMGFDEVTAVWRGMKTLPIPPSVTDSEDTTPAARSLHFLKGDSLLVSYLEHGIV